MLAAWCAPTASERGEVLLRAGDVPHTLMFVVSSLLRLFYLDETGNEFTKSFCFYISSRNAIEVGVVQYAARLHV